MRAGSWLSGLGIKKLERIELGTMVEALSNLKAASRAAEITHECGPRHIRVLIIDEGLSSVSFAIGDRAHARL